MSRATRGRSLRRRRGGGIQKKNLQSYTAGKGDDGGNFQAKDWADKHVSNIYILSIIPHQCGKCFISGHSLPSSNKQQMQSY